MAARREIRVMALFSLKCFGGGPGAVTRPAKRSAIKIQSQARLYHFADQKYLQ
jgi:hypothetical protein